MTTIDPNVRLLAAREYARWHYGSTEVADGVLDAYNGPISALARLADDDDTVAEQLLAEIRTNR